MEPDIFRFSFPNLQAGQGLMDEEESQHLLKVLRMKVGEPLVVTDGKGLKAQAKLLGNKGKLALIAFDKPELQTARNISLELAIALPKSADRVDWLISKATEIGVETLVPIITQRSERQKLNLDRLNRIAWSAIKQSRQWHLPVITESVSMEKYLMQNSEGLNFICHQHTENTPSLLEAVLKVRTGKICVMVGPEGDFSPEELKAAFQAKFQAVSLGRNRLRSETAGVFVCSMINAIQKQ